MAAKSQLDLLVRVRYTNPLPPPPYPPKLLNIPTDPKRYARVDFTQSLSNDTPLPMVVDAECGMPLDLCHFESLWDGSDPNADAADPPPIDPRDLFMLEGIAGTANAAANGVNVSWLRKTEYIARDTLNPRYAGGNTLELKPVTEIPIDVSLEAQIHSIEATFRPIDEPLILATLKHPTKTKLEAVEVFELLPDSDLWPNVYDVIRFAERPGERPIEEPDPRLESAILRPQQTNDGDHFISYYLPKEDEDAEDYKTRRSEGRVDAPPVPFHFMRDYETAKIEQDVSNEFLLVLDNLDKEGPTTHKTKGAYYMGITRKITLKKKRATKYDEPPQNKIDIYQVSHQAFLADEEKERRDAANVVNDPTWLARLQAESEKVEADAEGEVDEEHHPQPANGNGIHRHDEDMDED